MIGVIYFLQCSRFLTLCSVINQSSHPIERWRECRNVCNVFFSTLTNRIGMIDDCQMLCYVWIISFWIQSYIFLAFNTGLWEAKVVALHSSANKCIIIIAPPSTKVLNRITLNFQAKRKHRLHINAHATTSGKWSFKFPGNIRLIRLAVRVNFKQVCNVLPTTDIQRPFLGTHYKQ